MRNIDDQPQILRFPERPRSPVTWFLRLLRSLDESDPSMEATALRELSRIGFTVIVGRENRKAARS